VVVELQRIGLVDGVVQPQIGIDLLAHRVAVEQQQLVVGVAARTQRYPRRPHRLVFLRQDGLHQGVRSGGEVGGVVGVGEGRQLEQVGSAGPGRGIAGLVGAVRRCRYAARGVGEVPRRRRRGQDVALPQRPLRVAEVVQVGEEKQLVLQDRPADLVAVLVQAQLLAGLAVQVAEVIIGIERVVAQVLPAPAVPGVAALGADQRDLHRPLARLTGVAGRGGDVELLHVVHARLLGREKAAAGGALQQVVLAVDAVKGDVQRPRRQPVELAGARRGRGLHPRLNDRQLGGVARGDGHLRDLRPRHLVADRGLLRLDNLLAGLHLHGLARLADLQLGLQGVSLAHHDLHGAIGARLEAGVADQNIIVARAQVGHHEAAAGVGLDIEEALGRDLGHLHTGAGNRGGGRIGHGAGERAGGVGLRQRRLPSRQQQHERDPQHGKLHVSPR